MRWIINVVWQGHFFFRSEFQSFLQMKNCLVEIKRRFPKKEKFEISVTEYNEVGIELDLRTLKEIA